MAADPAVLGGRREPPPVAGLLGLAGRTLRHRDFVALRSLAQAPPTDLQPQAADGGPLLPPRCPRPGRAAARRRSLDGWGLGGAALERPDPAGCRRRPALAAELVRPSGLAELQRLLDVRLHRRSGALKAATALRGVERLLAELPVPGTEPLRADVERIQVASTELPELGLLMRLRGPGHPCVRLAPRGGAAVGAEGVAATDRLGLPAEAPDEELRAPAMEALTRWRDRAADPLTSRAAVDACDLLTRTCEEILCRLDGLLSVGVLAEPGPGRSAEEGEQRQHDETALH